MKWICGSIDASREGADAQHQVSQLDVLRNAGCARFSRWPRRLA